MEHEVHKGEMKRKNQLEPSTSTSSPSLHSKKIQRVSSASFSSLKNGFFNGSFRFNSGSWSNSSSGGAGNAHNGGESGSGSSKSGSGSTINVNDLLSKEPESTDASNNDLSLETTLTYGVSETAGKRLAMEDRYEVIPFGRASSYVNLKTSSSADSTSPDNDRSTSPEESRACSSAFFAIYDGHGGTACADFARDNLHSNILNSEYFNQDPERAILEGYKKTDDDFLEECTKNGGDGLVGTTALTVLISNNSLYVGNVGDSEAVLYMKDKIVKLTNPHTPKNKEEKNRIESVGGVLVDGHRLGHPVWNAQMINIAVTRALGNLYFKSPDFIESTKSGLIADPEVTKLTLTKDDSFILMASDGFWDVITPKEACAFVMEHRDRNPSGTCRHLIDMALKRSTADNTTVLLIDLHSVDSPKNDVNRS